MKKLLSILFLFLVPLIATATNFYPKVSGDLALLSSWGDANNGSGSGTAPTTFISTSDVFIINKNKSVLTTWTVKNLNVSASFVLTLNAATTITGVLTLGNAGNRIITNGNLLKIDLNTGSITGSGSINGNVTVTKNILSKGWHYLGTPLTNITVAQFHDNTVVKNSTCYYYDETIESSNMQNGWTSYSTLTDPITVKNGYILYYYNTGVIDYTGTYTYNSSYTTAVTNNYSNLIGAFIADGWNLISNPYPSTLDWDDVDRSNVNGAIYYWDGDLKVYKSYVNGSGSNGATKYVPSLQAFFVRANLFGSPKTVSFPSSARVSNTASLYRTTDVEQNILRVKASSPNTVDDETVIRISEFASDVFDGDWDAYKLFNGGNAVNIYTSADIKYSVNSVSDTFDVQKEISLDFFAPISDTYTLTFTNGFPSDYTVSIRDNVTNSLNTLGSGESSITFDYTVGDDSTRFTLLLDKSIVTDNTSSTNAPDALNIKITTNDNMIHINNPDNYNVSVYNYSGNEYSNSSNSDMNVPVNQGIYLVKIVSPKGTRTDKVFVK